MKIIKCNINSLDNILEIIPNEPFKDNCIYEIRIKNLKSKNGKVFNDVLKIYTKLSPLYSDIESVRSLIGDLDISDHVLLYQVREASKYADYLSPEPINEENIPFGVSQFVRYRAAFEAVLKNSVSQSTSNGISGTVGNVSFSERATNNQIKTLLKTLQDEITKWKDAVKGFGDEGRAEMQTAVKGKWKSRIWSPGYVDPRVTGFNRGVDGSGL